MAGNQFDAIAAGLEEVEEHALRDAVLVRARLDGRVMLAKNVGGAQNVRPVLQPEGDVMQPPGLAGEIACEHDVMDLVRHADPAGGLEVVIEHDVFAQAEAEL